ncbi:hypothetical protein EDB19DRAFT_1917213 [Suillus lakei]|nr:hypothetical protein EDB19DRAFT_1917213 [Suillus lakei]
MHPFMSSANTKGAGLQDMDIDDHSSNCSSLVPQAQEEDYDMNFADGPHLSSPPPPGQFDSDIGDARHSSVPPAHEVDTKFYGTVSIFVAGLLKPSTKTTKPDNATGQRSLCLEALCSVVVQNRVG